MKTNIRYTLLYFLILCSYSSIYAQFKVQGEVRPRFEYRHGFKTLVGKDIDAAAFVSQRTRITSTFKRNKLNMMFSFQDIRIWGDVPQLTVSDRVGSSVHQAWGQFYIDSMFSVKVGRQPISYDDERIVGAAQWAQQARVHDVAKIQFEKPGLKIHSGIAYNESSASLTGSTPVNSYKNLQYLWINKQWPTFSASFLFLNNGLQNFTPTKFKTYYSQTLGTHLKYNVNDLSFASNLYGQVGKDRFNNDLRAFLFSLNADYKLNATLTLTAGGEIQSGNDNGTIKDEKNNAFTPLYGTNHRYNGHMDYFYTGNHLNNIGLINIYLKSKIALSNSFDMQIALHNFSSAADFDEKQLGNEIDFAFNYNIQKDVNLKFGYSQMFAGDGMKILKAEPEPALNNWGWMMLTINPTLFEIKTK